MTWLGGEQVIPRPSGSYAGDLAPWAGIPPEQRVGLSMERVVTALHRHFSTLYESDGQGASPTVVPDVFIDGVINPSAVLVAMFEEEGETRVILTRRSQKLRSHKGEVSFPGGRCDTGETPEQCALREAHEETGLWPESVKVIGSLSPLTTFSSQSYVQPMVGTLASRPALEASPAEVERVFDTKLSDLATDEVFREERWQFSEEVIRRERAALFVPVGSDGSFPVWFFELPGDTVWGATARILVELLTAVLLGT
jgi:8-oxo-dGTP pyrophosphatase MutT (NUDIX family)